jgi:hypothetical protein
VLSVRGQLTAPGVLGAVAATRAANSHRSHTSCAGSAPGYSAGSGAVSARVTCPVAATNSAKSLLVTGWASMWKPPTATRYAGDSPG